MSTVPHDFWRSWDACGRQDPFVRYSRVALERVGVPPESADFLADAGLPDWAAPNMWFFFRGDPSLPSPEDPYGASLPDEFAGVGMIGSTAEGWPIGFDPAHPGRLICVELAPTPRPIALNSSAQQLAECLLAYHGAVSEALAYGEARGEEDAWRQRRYPREIDWRLAARIAAIDPLSWPDGYWERHFRDRGDDT